MHGQALVSYTLAIAGHENVKVPYTGISATFPALVLSSWMPGPLYQRRGSCWPSPAWTWT